MAAPVANSPCPCPCLCERNGGWHDPDPVPTALTDDDFFDPDRFASAEELGDCTDTIAATHATASRLFAESISLLMDVSWNRAHSDTQRIGKLKTLYRTLGCYEGSVLGDVLTTRMEHSHDAVGEQQQQLDDLEDYMESVRTVLTLADRLIDLLPLGEADRAGLAEEYLARAAEDVDPATLAAEAFRCLDLGSDGAEKEKKKMRRITVLWREYDIADARENYVAAVGACRASVCALEKVAPGAQRYLDSVMPWIMARGR